MGGHALQPLLIFPYNGNGLEALDCLKKHRCVAFIEDNSDKHGVDTYGNLVMGREALAHWPDAAVLAVPGSPRSYRARPEIIGGLQVDSARYAQVVHPSARVSTMARLGRNVLIMAGVVVTSNAVIEDHVCILPNSVVHHDTVLGAYTLVGAGVTIAGGVRIGPNCYIGSGSSIKDGLRIGERSLVGLGSVVIRDLDPDSRVAGSPAKLLPPGPGIRRSS